MELKNKVSEKEVRYVRLENEEGILTKRYILSTQMYLLKILEAMKRYHQGRISELKIKAKLLDVLKDVKQNVEKIQINIPKLTTFRYFTKEKESGKMEIKEVKKPMKYQKDVELEMQLKDIQEKLRALQR